MKLALCLHGQPRNYKYGYNYLKSILKSYDVDTYIHMWWDKSVVDSEYESAPWLKNPKIENNMDESIKALYKPKKILIDTPRKFIPLRYYEGTADFEGEDRHDLMFNNISSRMYSLQKVLSLIDKEDYDFYIITRFDILISSLPYFSSFQSDKIYTNTGHEKRLIYNDFMWIVGKKHLNVFKSIYDDIDDIYDGMSNLTERHKRMVNYDDEICNGQYGILPKPGVYLSRLGAEEIFSYNFLFKGVINDVIKDSRIVTNVKR